MKSKSAAWNVKRIASNLVLLALIPALVTPPLWADAAETYNPLWAGELNWASGEAPYVAPVGSKAYVENQFDPWWVTQVAHPITDYDASKLPVGAVRLDSAVDLELTTHRALPRLAGAKFSNQY